MGDSVSESRSLRRLLLASRGLGALREFVGHRAPGGRVAFVPTAANAIDPSYASTHRDLLEGLGLLVTTLELETADRQVLQSTLRDVDLVFVEGGNVFYLLHHVRRSGFSEVLPPLLNEGRCAYVGVSAGAVILGPDVWPASQAGRDQVPELASTKGLGLIDFVVIAHHDDPSRKTARANRLSEFGRKYRLVFLDDDHAIEIDGEGCRLVYSP